MSDDIVTRLRGELLIRLNGEPWVTVDALPVLHEAAGEIERLREQNEHLKANVEMLLAEAKEAERG